MAEQPPERYGSQVFSTVGDAERRRLAAMAAVCDPTTTRVLTEAGIGPGWRCLEVGAGNGSVATWMAGQVAGEVAGETGADPAPAVGHVVATDIDTRFLTGLTGPHLTVLEHDVVTDPLPEGSFELIHARFVLEHLPERERALRRLADALAPGGVLVVESIASFPLASSPHPAFRTAMESVERVLAEVIGTDTTWPRTFPAPLLRLGLVDVGSSVHLPATGGRNASALCWSLTLAQLRPRIAQLLPEHLPAVDESQRLLDDPDFFDFSFATPIAWGRRSPNA